MDKRTFLKAISAMTAGPFVSPMFSWAASEKLHNWAGNIEYSTEDLHDAKSLAEVQAFVRKQPKFKVLGTRHCFNQIADSSDAFLSLKSLDDVISLDAAARTVTVSSGITYGKLSPWLHEKGFALHNLASLPHISVAGACTTATHGSGQSNGNLSTAVSALELVTANGEVLKLSHAQDGETFLGAVVGLGALGVITKVTLDVQPTFYMAQFVYENLPLQQLVDHFDEIEAAAYSVSLFTDWQNKRINEVWLKSRAAQGVVFKVKDEFFGGKIASRNLHPIAELSAENCTEQMGVVGPWYERLPHFKMGFTPSAGKELQTEYFVPRKHAVEAILAVERLHDQITPHLMITEIRTIAADNYWMSPARHQDSVAIHFTWKQDWPAVKALLPTIERELAPFNARPHWGKLFTMDPKQLQSRYENLSDFIQLAKKLDPQGKFRNAFLNTNIFSV